jgi:hypothetical protein
MRCGGCGEAVKYVIVGHRTVAVEPEPHERGTIACPTDRYKNLAYVLDTREAPSRGYTRHRRHTHPKED